MRRAHVPNQRHPPRTCSDGRREATHQCGTRRFFGVAHMPRQGLLNEKRREGVLVHTDPLAPLPVGVVKLNQNLKGANGYRHLICTALDKKMPPPQVSNGILAIATAGFLPANDCSTPQKSDRRMTKTSWKGHCGDHPVRCSVYGCRVGGTMKAAHIRTAFRCE